MNPAVRDLQYRTHISGICNSVNQISQVIVYWNKMKLVSILPHRHSFPKKGFGREGDNLLISIPRVETRGYQHVAPSELIFIKGPHYKFHLMQSLFLWAWWSVVAAGRRLASAAIVPIAIGMPRLVPTAVRDWFFCVKAIGRRKKT